MFAIAAENFYLPSETFVRQHARLIAPGHTVLLCQESQGAFELSPRVLDGIAYWPPPRPGVERIRHAVRRRWRKYITPEVMGRDKSRIAEFLKAQNVTTMMAEFADVGVLYVGACRDANVRLFVHVHGFDVSTFIPHARWRRWYRKLFKHVAGIIAPSHFLAQKLLDIGCPPEKMHVCYNGVDPSRFRPTTRLPGRFLAVGRLVEKKAPHLAIAAFAETARRFPEARLDVIGDGHLKPLCEQAISESQLQGRVVLHGAQPPEFVAEKMHEASFFVQHSVTAPDGDTEGMGISLIEAMASEIPIIATRHNGFPEVIVHNQTGILVDEHDVAGMSAALIKLYQNPELALDMGKAGRERVLQQFSESVTIPRLRQALGIADSQGVT